MMNNNPYRKVVDHKIKGSIVLPGQSSSLFNKTGEINASSTPDLLAQIGKALQNQQSVVIQATPQEMEARRQERRQVLVEAMGDQSGRSMQILGEALAAEIYETTNREGFTRRILQYREIGQGENNEVYLKDKDVIAFVATSPSTVMASEIRQRRLLPPEFHVNGYILIDTAELARTSSDLLEEKYEQGLEAIMVQEDRLWKIMADRAAIIRNTLQNFGTFTPSVFARIIEQVNRWGVPATSCLFASNLWQDIIANGDFAGVLDPVTKWELLQEGYLGSMYGVTIFTDNFRQANLKVLEAGEVYVCGAPINLGVLSLRGAMTAEPINKFAEGEAKRGWFLDEIISLVVGNAMAVAKGLKI